MWSRQSAARSVFHDKWKTLERSFLESGTLKTEYSHVNESNRTFCQGVLERNAGREIECLFHVESAWDEKKQGVFLAVFDTCSHLVHSVYYMRHLL
jgi:hypothetical protein